MIRTRDLVLFLTSFVLLALAIFFTLTRQHTSSSFLFDAASIPEWGTSSAEVAGSEAVIDRAANAARLREKLALDTSTVTPLPDTFVEDIPITETDAPQAPVVAVDRCLYPDDVLPHLAAWPMGKVIIAAEGSNRLAFSEEMVAALPLPGGTSTVATEPIETVRTTYLTLPIVPVERAVPSCVPSEVVGITPSGILLLNSDAAIWQNINADGLIGYARDGYPIYGRYDGLVDACGGYDPGSGYRYTIAADRAFMVGCFKATPQPFSL